MSALNPRVSLGSSASPCALNAAFFFLCFLLFAAEMLQNYELFKKRRKLSRDELMKVFASSSVPRRVNGGSALPVHRCCCHLVHPDLCLTWKRTEMAEEELPAQRAGR